MTRLAEEFATLWGRSFGRIQPRDEQPPALSADERERAREAAERRKVVR
jgi:hypothetical protein